MFGNDKRNKWFLVRMMLLVVYWFWFVIWFFVDTVYGGKKMVRDGIEFEISIKCICFSSFLVFKICWLKWIIWD